MGGAIRAVVFDLDGTLVDSAPDIACALNEALGQLGYPPLALDVIVRMVGGGAKLLAERGLVASGAEVNPSTVDALYDAFHASYQRNPAHLSTLYPGAHACLVQLKAQGIGLGVCTNKPEPLTGPILAALGIAPLFRSVVAASPALALKPDPGMLRKCLQDLSVAPTETVMIGDSAADVGVARAAGVPVILVSHGYTSIPAAQLGADAVINGFSELLPALNTVTRAGSRMVDRHH
jgi:phosphoglycolate phosphatase